MNIPVPVFVGCDETSLKVKCVEQKGTGPKDSFPPEGYRLELEYKDAQLDGWGSAKSLQVDASNEFNGEEIGDLEPGTPYYVRFKLVSLKDESSFHYGPETGM